MMNDTDRVQALSQMQSISNGFYQQAIQAHVHPFIEFTGLMNEYIKMAQEAHKRGQDFTNATGHFEESLPMEPYNAEYLAEKFDCIFGPTFRANPEAWKAFKRKMEGG